jgi:hypothetical protein
MRLRRSCAVSVKDVSNYESVLHITLKIPDGETVQTFPGCYFYLHYGTWSSLTLWRGKAALAFWSSERGSVGSSADSISLLLELKAGSSIEKWKHVRLDGPYGIPYKFEQVETVVLVARGLGIAGVLPYAAHLASRRRFDDHIRREPEGRRPLQKKYRRNSVYNDLCNRVHLFWWLETVPQEEWARKELKKLQRLDSTVS